MSKDATYDHVIKYTGLFGGTQGLTMLMSIVRTKIVSLLLGPSGVALVNIYNNVIKLINEATNFGIPFSAVKHVAEMDEEEVAGFVRVTRTWTLATGLLGTLICLTLSPVISHYAFGNDKYTFTFAALSPIVAMMTVQGGELAVLKGLKALNSVALISVFTAVLTVAICTPIYYFWGVNGIVPTLLLINATLLTLTLYYSTRIIPWATSLTDSSTYHEGMPMVRLGIGYIVAGIFGQGADLVIRLCLKDWGSLTDVGLYNSGYMLVVTYASLVFNAIEADFFPRLSAVQKDIRRQNSVINQQTEVCLLLMAPLLVLFSLCMPIIIPLLFSSRFTDAVPMAICATGYMYFKALTLPTAYLPLAKGESKIYMATELAYDILIAAFIPLTYRYFGLIGTGVALSIAGLADMLIIHICYAIRYGFRINTRNLPYFAAHGMLLACAILISLHGDILLTLTGGTLTFVVSLTLTLYMLRRKSSILGKIKRRLYRK